MKTHTNSYVIDVLEHTGLASPERVARVRERASSGEDVWACVEAECDMHPDEFRRVYALSSGVPWVSLVGKKISGDILSRIPEPFARTREVVAFDIDEGQRVLYVATTNHRHMSAMRELEKTTGHTIAPRLTDETSLRHALLQYQRYLHDQYGERIRHEALSLGEADEGRSPQALCEHIVSHACLQHATDIHIEPDHHVTRVRYRINNVLHDAMTLPAHVASAIASFLRTQAASLSSVPEGRTSVMCDGERTDMRFSFLPTHKGEKTVIRLLRSSKTGFTLESLGFHGRDLEHVHHTLREPLGLTLVTGLERSGISTSLYTFVDLANTPDVNISTIEDPVEYHVSQVNQTQVDPGRGLTFEQALRIVSQQDPDIVMVSDIRDQETLEQTLRVAQTRCRIWAGVRAPSATDALAHCVDMGVDADFFAQTIRTVIHQRILPRMNKRGSAHVLTRDQRELVSEYADMDKVLALLKEEGVVAENATWDTVELYRDSRDDSTGGSVLIHEVCQVTPAVQTCIAEHKKADVIEKTARSEGMATLAEDALFKAVRGDISLGILLEFMKQYKCLL